jgi:hypothetical protein
MPRAVISGCCSYCWFCSFCASQAIFAKPQNIVTLRKYQQECRDLGRDSGQEAMKAHIRRLLRQRLSTQVVIMMVAILAITMAVGFAVVRWNLNRQLNQQYQDRALAVAQALASQPGLQQAVLTGDPGGVGPQGAVQSMAMAAMHSTAATFVVVTNGAGIRYSHPKPGLIGEVSVGFLTATSAT